MTNNNNKKMITGIKSKGIYMGKNVGDIQNVFIFCLFKKIESSSPRLDYNVITFLSNKFPYITNDSKPRQVITVVSLFPDYFYKAYGVIDNSNINVLSLVQFMFYISDSFKSDEFDLNNLFFVFHGFRWSQILRLFKLYHVDIFGVKVPVRHTVNSLQIQLFSYLIPLFGSLEAVGKHLIEGTDFSTFWGSAKLDNPLYSTKQSYRRQFLSISIEFSFIVSNFFKVKELLLSYFTNQNELLAIQSEIDSFSHEKNSLLSKKDSDIHSKEVQISSLGKEAFIHSNTLTAFKPKQIKNKKNIEKKQEKFKQYLSTPEGDKEDKSKNIDVKIQKIETNINRLTVEKENISSVLSNLMVQHEDLSNHTLSWLYEVYSSEWLLELKADLNNTFSSFDEDIRKDKDRLSLYEEDRKKPIV
jgi:hypothetical protein